MSYKRFWTPGDDDREWVAGLLLSLGVPPEVVTEFNAPFVSSSPAPVVRVRPASATEFNAPEHHVVTREMTEGHRHRFFVRAYDEDNQFVREIDVRAPDADEALRLAIRQRFSNEVLFDPPLRGTL